MHILRPHTPSPLSHLLSSQGDITLTHSTVESVSMTDCRAVRLTITCSALDSLSLVKCQVVTLVINCPQLRVSMEECW